MTTETDFVVGQPINLTVEVYAPATLTLNVDRFEVEADNALTYTGKGEPFFSHIPMKLDYAFGALARWSGSQVIQYTVTGSFGLNLAFYKYVEGIYQTFVGEAHTNVMFSIGSQDSLTLKRSQSLTMTLTFLLLFFVAMEFDRHEPR